MIRFIRLAVGAGAALGLSAGVGTAVAQAAPTTATPAHGAARAVFVQTDELAGNRVVAYTRGEHGSLAAAGSYATGGLGGALNGAVVDHLASQGALAYDAQHGLLYAVNAGSDSVTVFAVDGARLARQQVIGSGGSFPVSVAVHGDLVYVLDARDGGRVVGFRVAGRRLQRLVGSGRGLGLDLPTDPTEFTHTPGQVAFSPDGRQLIVTTKAGGSSIDVYGVGRDGRLSAHPVVNAEAGSVPFAVSFDAQGHLVVADAGTNALTTYRLAPSGTVVVIQSVATGQAATCWVAPARWLLLSNAGSGTVSGYRGLSSGRLVLLGATPTDPGTVDADASRDGQFVYVQTGANGIVDAFRVRADGSLTAVGSVTVPGAAGGEGIVAL